MAHLDHAKRVFGPITAALGAQRRFRILAGVLLMIVVIRALAPVLGGGIATVIALAALFVLLPERRRVAGPMRRLGQ